MAKWCVLKKNTEFRTAYYRGKSLVDPLFILYVRKNRYGIARMGITTGKKIGKAVARNRSRRVIREAYRQLWPAVKPGMDYVFVARKATVYAKSTEVAAAMRSLFQQEGLLV